ncbi:phage terminase small subunit P27 family [Lactobacillus hominis]|uniref:phage terminase small subunit P27 family n=1 Tax=Lactobacillus hominis TaxID=1203033 RepID=UPI0023F49CBD|nr:phage terminase small subunit P27 family [Lactobacillus hominis]
MKGGSKLTNVDLTKPKVPTQAPKWLGNYGKRMWPKLAAYLNKNSKIIRADEYLLQQYCSTYDLYRMAYDEIQKEGLQSKIYKTVVSPVDGSIVAKNFAGFRKNPAVQTMSDSLSKLNSIGRELGLSPRARSEMLELNAPEEKKKSVAESMKEFFNND